MPETPLPSNTGYLRSRLEGSSFRRIIGIFFLLLMALFAVYLVDGLIVSLREVLRRLSSSRPLNLDIKVALLFQVSHLLSLPLFIYNIGRRLICDRSEEA